MHTIMLCSFYSFKIFKFLLLFGKMIMTEIYFFKIYFYLYVCFCVATCMSPGALRGRRVPQIPWSWSYRKL